MSRDNEGSGGLLEDYGFFVFGLIFILVGLGMILEFREIALIAIGGLSVIGGCVLFIVGGVGSQIDIISILKKVIV